MGLGSDLTPADIAACTGNGNDFGFGGNSGWWIILLFLVFGRNGWNNGGSGGNCATQADVRAAVDQQTLISKLDQQTYGLADSTYAINNVLNQNFRSVDNALCNVGYQALQNTNALQGAINNNTTQGIMNTNALSRQLSDCCCDMEKMNMQGRFDAQMYNNSTLIAIDKLGDRIIDYMCQNEKQALRDENFALRLSASQSNQNQYLVNQLRPAPVPSFNVPAPYNFGNCGCSCGCGC